MAIRSSRPGVENLKWYNVAPKGISYCQVQSGTCTLPNCVGQAIGRFMEMAGIDKCNLPNSNGGQMWYDVGNAYPKGQTPQVGAVGCYKDNYGGYGHVLIVEKVNADGSIYTSESAWGQPELFWFNQTLYPPYYTWSSQFSLQGFIYNTHLKTKSGKQVLQEFVNQAKAQINSMLSWTQKETGCGNIAWSGAYIQACAKRVGGILDAVIPNTHVVRDMFKQGVEKEIGKFIRGPQFKAAPKPQIGDLVSFRTINRVFRDEYDADAVGLVVEVLSNTFVCVIGNQDSNNIHLSVVAKKQYKLSTNTICGYYRPDWAKLNSPNLDLMNNGVIAGGQLFNTQNTAEDAIIREVGYLSDNYEPSISTSQIRLSVVNYTDMLNDIASSLGMTSSMLDSGSVYSNVITDGMQDTTARAIANYFLGKGLNAAAAIAIVANIYRESSFNLAAVGDGGTSFGLCQWHYGRGDNMKRMAGPNWSTNLTGQLDYLWSELTGGAYNPTLNALRTCDNTLSGCKGAVSTFVIDFERPRDTADEIAIRQGYAATFWQQIVVQKV